MAGEDPGGGPEGALTRSLRLGGPAISPGRRDASQGGIALKSVELEFETILEKFEDSNDGDSLQHELLMHRAAFADLVGYANQFTLMLPVRKRHLAPTFF